MARRREHQPLLGGAIRGSWRHSPYFASFVGVLVGVGLGSLVTLTLFEWLPSPTSAPGQNDPFQNPQASQVSPHQPTTFSRPPSIEAPRVVSVDGFNTSNEGTREISAFESAGGWRFTPDIMEVARRHPKGKVLSENSPRLMVFERFISPEEAEHLVGIAKTHMGRSKVVADPKKGSEVSKARTSYGAWLSNKWRDSVVVDIEKRIHDTVGIPHDFGEGMYVLRYEQEQKYDPHSDNCGKMGEKPKDACLDFTKRAGGPQCGEGQGGATCGDRVATFILYLRSPTKGGSTVFPNADITKKNIYKGRRSGKINWNSGPKGWYCDDPLVLKVSPKPGDAVLFWDYVPRVDVNHKTYPRTGGFEMGNGDTEVVDDRGALHGGCPVIEGEKWIATRWIRSSKFV